MESPQPSRSQTSDWPQGAELEIAARYIDEIRRAPTRATQARALMSRRGAVALAEVLRRLPVVRASFTDDANGRELRSWFHPNRRLPVDRAPIAVLHLPDTHASYLRGRQRQALRTNCRRASETGIVCSSIEDSIEFRRVIAHLATLRRQSPPDMVTSAPREGLRRSFFAAYDTKGDPLALAETIIDQTWAGIGALITATDHPQAPNSRYLLHTRLVEELIGSGVRTVTVGGSMLLTSAGTRYFQRRVGYSPARISLRSRPR